MTTENSTSRYKVERLIEKYNLTEIGKELEERWTRSENRQGLRQLADYFNQRLLQAALIQSEADPLEGEVENLYRLLTDDDVSSGVQIQTRNTIEQRGIDVDELEQDFVSYQSIYTYLTNHREVTPPDETPSKQEQLDQRLDTIQRLKTRLTTITERSLQELVNADRLTLGNFNVLVTVRVQCTDCNTRLSVVDILSSGGCECTREGAA